MTGSPASEVRKYRAADAKRAEKVGLHLGPGFLEIDVFHRAAE
jgi:hypothetical protein